MKKKKNESENVNLKHMCKSKAKEHDDTLSKYDNDSKEKTSSMPDEEEEKALNVLNGLLNTYEYGKNIFQ